MSRTVGLAFATTAIVLSFGFGLKNQCTGHVWDGFQYRSSCYNDIFGLYTFRGLHEEPIPYIHGSGELDDDVDENGNRTERGDLEYPVGTGLLIAAVALATSNGVTFFHLTSLILAMCAGASMGALAWLAADKRRLFYLALAPTLALYAFHNWDLFAVAAMVGALALFARGSDRWAGAAMGFGAASKVFPGILLPVFVIARYRQTRKIPWAMVGISAAVFIAMNLPFALINAKGWFMPWDFQSTRFPNFETHWYMLYRHFGLDGTASSFWWTIFPKGTSLASLGLFAISGAWLLRAETRRETFRPYTAAFGLMLLFLLTGKVYSPQFNLWLLPFFVLVRMQLRTFIVFSITDAAVWIAVSYFFLNGNDPSRMDLLEVTVWVRYVALAWILWKSRSAEDNVAVPEPPTPAPVLVPV